MARRTVLFMAAILATMGTVLFLAYGAPGATADQTQRKPWLCTSGQIVPGSVEVFSTSSVAGEIAGHTIHFQLCPPQGGEDGGQAGSPADGSKHFVALFWKKPLGRAYPEDIGVSLRDAGGRTWLAETNANWRWRFLGSTEYYDGVAVEFPPLLHRSDQDRAGVPVDL